MSRLLRWPAGTTRSASITGRRYVERLLLRYPAVVSLAKLGYRGRRVTARDGRVWTERVAATGQALLVFGQDPLAPPERTDADVTPTLVRLVDAVCTAELAHLRAEVETWRGVAEERGRALTTALNALESLAAQPKQLSTEPTERSVDQWRATRTPTLHPDPRTEPRNSAEIPAAVEAPAAKSSLVSIPDKVRTAALAELHTMTLKQQRWWQRPLYTRRNS